MGAIFGVLRQICIVSAMATTVVAAFFCATDHERMLGWNLATLFLWVSVLFGSLGDMDEFSDLSQRNSCED